MRIILTGPRGAGKTTAAMKIIEANPNLRITGFKTLLMPDDKLYMWGADEEVCALGSCLLAEPVAQRDGRSLKAIPGAFDAMAEKYVHPAPAGSLLYMDELGYAEAGETVFRDAVLKAAEGSENFIAVVRDGFPGWTRRLAELPGTRVIKLFESCGSTSDECGKMMTEEGFENPVVMARTQTDGRGRAGRSFASPRDKGVYMSFGFYSDRNRDELPLYSREIAQITADVLSAKAGINAAIKAPNDVMYGGKKLCGILPDLFFGEDGRARLVIGIGVNLLEDGEDFGDLKDIAASVKMVSGKTPDPTVFAIDLLNALDQNLKYRCK